MMGLVPGSAASGAVPARHDPFHQPGAGLVDRRRGHQAHGGPGLRSLRHRGRRPGGHVCRRSGLSRAEPLFMLDYIATGKVDPDRIATVVGGIQDGCRRAGCVLIGGETAEHPGADGPDDLDIAASPWEQSTAPGCSGPHASRWRRHHRHPLAGTALQRLHAGPPRAARAGRAQPGRPGVGRGHAPRWPTSSWRPR